jgi:diguanylate cyclase (GGDEF)-like protein
MIDALIPDNETERLASVKSMQLLSTPAEEAFDRITRITQRIFKTPTVFISIFADTYMELKSKIGVEAERMPRHGSMCNHVVYSGEMILIEDARKDARFANNDVRKEMDIRFYAGRPLRNSDGFIVGTLCVCDHRSRKITDEERETIDAIGHWVESVFEARGLSKAMESLLAELDEVRRDSMMDSLLHIWNRGAIMDILKREADQAHRQKTSVAVMMADMDHFKKINDTYGHHIGDAALSAAVKALRHELRSYDSVGRYGGEEFLIVLPNISRDDACMLADRLRGAVETFIADIEGHLVNCTISMGVSTADFSLGRQDVEQKVIDADQALLRAKTNGRNRVEVAG